MQHYLIILPNAKKYILLNNSPSVLKPSFCIIVHCNDPSRAPLEIGLYPIVQDIGTINKNKGNTHN